MSLKDKLKSAIDSAKIIAKNLSEGKEMFVADEVFHKRMACCQKCDKHIKSTNQCGECFCFLSAKGKIADMKCPLGKWEE